MTIEASTSATTRLISANVLSPVVIETFLGLTEVSSSSYPDGVNVEGINVSTSKSFITFFSTVTVIVDGSIFAVTALLKF